MRLFVNGLSLGSLSGRHVLYGHVRQLALAAANRHEFIVLHQAGERLPEELRLPNVRSEIAPSAAAHWSTRMAWEAAMLPRLIRRTGCDRYFTPAGTILPRSPVPQVSLAQNPWCLMPDVPRGAVQRFKARLQRAAYRRAFAQADLMVYNSRHMLDLYRRNAAGAAEGPSLIVYQGINSDTFAAAARNDQPERHRQTIVSVSAMARWKGAETLVAALAMLRREGIDALLRLVGPWPDSEYEQFVRRQVAALQLEPHVTFTGQVPGAQLHREYASPAVFCLMSKCESFGIPAIEAQAFGTPVVGSNVCAMPEIGGEGGVFVAPDNPSQTAQSLKPFLTDPAYWNRMSAAAKRNAERFHWEICSQPLQAIFDIPPRRNQKLLDSTVNN